MAAIDVGTRNAPLINDDLDDIFNYDVDTDLFREVDTNMDVAHEKPIASRPKDPLTESGLGLGLDEEIKVTKKRAPIAKLDEARLLSQAGIPKLRRTAKERLRFKGKGHEYSDVARLLNFYQLWLDDLYPRAKFADGLIMIEKLGHKNRMQIMRREWINEGKARNMESVEGQENHKQTHSMEEGQRERQWPSSKAQEQDSSSPMVDSQAIPKDSSLESRSQKPPDHNITADESLFISDDEAEAADDIANDDLDALLAEDDALRNAAPAAVKAQNASGETKTDNFDDEEEAMAGMDDMW